MKVRNLVAILAIISIAFSSAAQSVFNSGDNTPYWGLRGSLNVNIPGEYKTPIGKFDYKTGAGFSIGAIYNIPVVANLYFEPGLSFYYDSFKMDELTFGTDEGEIINTESPKVVQTGFRVPLNIGYRFDLFENGSISIFTGPEFGIGISANVKSNALESEGIKTNLYNDNNAMGADGAWHRFSASWNIGAQLAVGEHFVFGLVGNIGVSDLVESDKVSFRENAIRITFGYDF